LNGENQTNIVPRCELYGESIILFDFLFSDSGVNGGEGDDDEEDDGDQV
jgi:hypothetical protein